MTSEIIFSPSILFAISEKLASGHKYLVNVRDITHPSITPDWIPLTENVIKLYEERFISISGIKKDRSHQLVEDKGEKDNIDDEGNIIQKESVIIDADISNKLNLTLHALKSKILDISYGQPNRNGRMYPRK